VVVRFEWNEFTGSTIPNLPRGFEITSNNAESISVDAFNTTTKCKFMANWNAWMCEDEFSVLIFDSLDDDRMDRSSQPIYIYAREDDRDGKE
jgi:hypothetical protein